MNIVIDLVLDYFQIKMDFMERAHLLDLKTKEVVWVDKIEENRSFFLFFLRKGAHLSPRRS